MLLKILLIVASAALCLAGGPSEIARPCFRKSNGYDMKCVQDNISAKSKCRRQFRPDVSSLRRYRVPRMRFEAPHFNASYIDNDLWVTGQHRCFISEFFFNVAKDSGVLGIDCPYLNFVSDRTLYQHWPLQEDTVYNYRINGTYPLIRLTTNLYRANALDICKEFTFAYVAQLPTFHIDPKDRATKSFLSSDLSMLNIFERETFLYRANMLMRRVVNKLICDFGCY